MATMRVNTPLRVTGILVFGIAYISFVDQPWISMSFIDFKDFLPSWPDINLGCVLSFIKRIMRVFGSFYLLWYLNCYYLLRKQYKKLLTKVKCVMYHYKVPKPIQERVLQCYSKAWHENKIKFPSSKLSLYILPKTLREVLVGYVRKTIVDKVRMYNQCFLILTAMSSKVKTETYNSGDIVFMQGTIADKIYLVSKGVLEALTFTGERLEIMSSGDIIGEIGVMHIEGYNTRTASVRALIDAELLAINKIDFNEIINRFPDTKRMIINIGKKRLQRSKASGPEWARPLFS